MHPPPPPRPPDPACATASIGPGTVLPEGTYRLGAERHARVLAALGAETPPDGSAHPIAAWIIALGGLGLGIDELFDGVGVAMADGPMLGACAIDWATGIGIETSYTVRGTVVGIEPKTGRALGRFDVMELRLEVLEPAGGVAAVCTGSMILPRRSPAA